MNTQIHMSLDIEGALKNGRLGYFTDENGDRIPARLVKDMLRTKLAKGERVMLLGDPDECPNFHPVTGCPGHELNDTEPPDGAMILTNQNT